MNPALLILACRDPQRGEAARKEVEQSVQKGSSTKVELWSLDLSSFASVKQFVAKFESTGHTLNVLLSNAGISTEEWHLTKDGFESTLQTNHLSNLLLLSLLRPLLRKAAASGVEPRVVVVASEVHFWAAFKEGEYPDPIAAMSDPNRSNMSDRYFASKLLNLFMTRALGSSFAKDGISLHCLNPGFCYSSLVRNASYVKTLLIRLGQLPLARSTEVGSRTLVHACVHEDLLLKNGPGGRYWSDCEEHTPSKTAVQIKLQQDILKESYAILEKVVPGVTQL